MKKRYYNLTVKFRNQQQKFALKCENPTQITDEEVHKIVCEENKTPTISASEISYTKTEITSIEYRLSKFKKVSIMKHSVCY